MKRLSLFLLAMLPLNAFQLAHAQVTAGYTPIYHFNVPTGGYDGVGNVLQYTDTANGNWTLTYDPLNRLSTAAATSGPYNSLGLNFAYDSFGNRTAQTASGTPPVGTVPSRWAVFDSANRMTSSDTSTSPNSIQYDPAGNMTFNGSVSVAYDDDGNVCATQAVVVGGAVTQYLYDAEGHRVAKGYSASNPTALTCSDGSTDFIPTATYALGQSGEQVTELDGSGAWKHTNVYANGALVATYDTTSRGLHFYIDDPLGSRRVQVSSLGEVEQNCNNMPFGDNAQAQQPCTNSGSDSYGNAYLANATDPTEHHFTGKERDAESGLDYFGARYYGSSMGRFMSPDPVGGSLSNPQSLNRYAYVLNNPLRNTDPTGLDCVYKGDSAADSTVVRGDCLSDDDYGVFVDAHVDSLFDKGGDIWANVSAYTDQNNPYGGMGTPSVDPDDARIMQLAQGINQGAGALNNPSTYVAWYGASLVGAAGVLSAPAVLSSGVNASGLLGGSARVFFSGAGGAAGASAYAAANNAVTLTMTPLGRFADYLNGETGVFSSVQNGFTYAAWAQLSTWFAQGAQGTATYFEGVGGYQGPVWLNYELPTLVQRGIPIVTVPHP